MNVDILLNFLIRKEGMKIMNTTNLVIKIIGLIIITIGVVMIYDARRIAKKWFSFGDQNSSTRTLKIVGFITSLIGGIAIILS